MQPHLEVEQPCVRNEHLSRVVCDRPLREYTHRQPPGACRHARDGGIVHACVAQLCAEVRQIARDGDVVLVGSKGGVPVKGYAYVYVYVYVYVYAYAYAYVYAYAYAYAYAYVFAHAYAYF